MKKILWNIFVTILIIIAIIGDIQMVNSSHRDDLKDVIEYGNNDISIITK